MELMVFICYHVLSDQPLCSRPASHSAKKKLHKVSAHCYYGYHHPPHHPHHPRTDTSGILLCGFGAQDRDWSGVSCSWLNDVSSQLLNFWLNLNSFPGETWTNGDYKHVNDKPKGILFVIFHPGPTDFETTTQTAPNHARTLPRLPTSGCSCWVDRAQCRVLLCPVCSHKVFVMPLGA